MHSKNWSKRKSIFRQNKNAQSSMEYMLTYGWAIIIIVIVAAFLYSFGVFTPSSSLTAVTTGFSGFQVQAECVAGVGMFLSISNEVGQPIILTSLNLTQPNGSAVSKHYDVSLLPGGSQIFVVLGVCQSGKSTYSIPGEISYVSVESPLKSTLLSTGKISGPMQTTLSGNLAGLLSNTYAFGTPYIGVPYQTQEYYANGIFLGQVASPFPNTLADLNNGNVNCGAPYDTQGYTAVKAMYFTGNVSFNILTNDGSAVFYRNASSSSWVSIFGNASWKGQSAGTYGPAYVTAKAGLYYVAVDWTNICVGGVSAVSISGAYVTSPTWNVTAWTPLNSSIDLLPYKDVNASPALPINVSAEQHGQWNQSVTTSSCNSKSNLCTTIFDAFDMRNGTQWWVEYDGENISSTSSFISFTTAPGDYSYSLASPAAFHGGCKDEYSTTAQGTLQAGSSLPIFYGTTTSCFTIFNEIGLPNGASWSVDFNNNLLTSSAPDNITATSPQGKYSFSVDSTSYSGSNYYPCPASGYSAAGSTITIQYSTSASCSENVSVFYQSALPYGLNWTVNYNGINDTGSSSAISFSTATGSHQFKVYSSYIDYLHSGCIIEYNPSTGSGSLTAGDALKVGYNEIYNCTSVFTESGLPSGAYFNVSYKDINKSTASVENLTFYVGEGGGRFVVYPSEYSGKEYYPCPKNGTLPGGSNQTINFSISSVCS